MAIGGNIAIADQVSVIQLLSSRADAFNALWGYYLTVGLAVLGFLVAYRQAARGFWGYAVAAGFATFAASNYYGLHASLQQRWALFKEYGADLPPDLAAALEPSSICLTAIVHCAGTVSIVLLCLHTARSK